MAFSGSSPIELHFTRLIALIISRPLGPDWNFHIAEVSIGGAVTFDDSRREALLLLDRRAEHAMRKQ